MKQCVICGEDCSGKPRTKDRQGRYYCQACHDAALAKKRAGGGDVAVAATDGPDNMAFDVSPGEGEGYDIMGSILDSAPTAASVPPPPPSATVPVTTHGAPRQDEAPVGKVWSTTLSLLSVLWAMLEMLVAMGLHVTAVAESSSAGEAQLRRVIAVIAGGFALSLFLGGFGCVLRRPGATLLLHLWAWPRILIAFLAIILGFGKILKRMDGEGFIFTFAAMRGPLLLLAIPCVFCLFLLSRPSCEREIEGWR